MSEIKILKFFGTYCSPCRSMNPIIKQVKEEMNLKVIECDVDVNENIFTQYNIRAIPTLVFLKNELEVGRKTGLIGKADLIGLIEQYRKD